MVAEANVNRAKSIKTRMPLIDIMKIVFMLLIYMRHSITMYGCTYGLSINEIAKSLTSPVMSGFFILSGFLIHYSHRNELLSSSWIRSFFIKRLLAIMPSYLLVVVIWPLAYPKQIREWFMLLPVDLLGIQTMYRTLFGILHNGGTWFVSCIIFCYVSYPILKAVLDSSGKWTAMTMFLIVEFLLMYSNVIIPKYSLDSLYSNPIARILEFLVGVAFCEIGFLENRICRHKIINMNVLAVFMSVCMAGLIAFISRNNMDFSLLIRIYSPIPVIVLLLSIANYINKDFLGSPILSSFSEISYHFFLAQLFLWSLTSWVLNLLNLAGNTAKITMSLSLCIAISFFAHKVYDKVCRELFGCFLLKINNGTER